MTRWKNKQIHLKFSVCQFYLPILLTFCEDKKYLSKESKQEQLSKIFIEITDDEVSS